MSHQPIPKFASEEEEAARRLSQTNLPGASETVTIRIPPEELARARTLAAKRGIPYQTYLKMLLHEALDAEEKKLAS
jgi:predicted DNA binding CopG/RHH family protein